MYVCACALCEKLFTHYLNAKHYSHVKKIATILYLSLSCTRLSIYFSNSVYKHVRECSCMHTSDRQILMVIYRDLSTSSLKKTEPLVSVQIQSSVLDDLLQYTLRQQRSLIIYTTSIFLLYLIT